MSNQKSKVTRQAEEINRLSLMIEKHDREIDEKANERMIGWMRELVEDFDRKEGE